MGGEATRRGLRNTPEQLLDLVGDIYQAGLEPERWPAVIARMSEAFQADLACIYTPFPARPEQSLYLTHNFSAAMESAYSAYYHRIDEWTSNALRQRRYIQGEVALGEDIIPQRELRRTEFYQDFLKPYDMEWMVSTVLFDGQGEAPSTHMTFTRNLERGGYDTTGVQLVELLAPHVRRALLTQWRLGETRVQRNLHATALNHLGHALVVLDQAGKVRFMTPLAEELVRRGEVLALVGGYLRARHSEGNAELSRLIRDACRGVGGSLSLARANFHGEGADPSLPYQISALPLREGMGLAALSPMAMPAQPGAMLLIHDPLRAGGPDARARFAAHYRLTPAETRVLDLLLQGLVPKHIAARHGVGISTVRTQLSSLFLKTGARNQRDLVALALGSGSGQP